MTTVDTEIQNALSSAQGASDFASGAFFSALVAALRAKPLGRAQATTPPTFTSTTLDPPQVPDPYAGEALEQMITSAAASFLAQFFGEEPEVDAAGAAARSWATRAASGDPIALMIPGVNSADIYFSGLHSTDDHPDYLPAEVDARLRTYASTTMDAARRVTKSNVAADLQAFALSSGLRWQNRGEALQSVAKYVVSAADAEAVGQDNATRIEAAKAQMETAIGRWIEGQTTQNYALKAEIALANKTTREDAAYAEAGFADVEAKIKAAVAGADQLLSIMRAAYGAISTVTSASQVGFG